MINRSLSQIEAIINFLKLRNDPVAKLSEYEYEACLDFGLLSGPGEDAAGNNIIRILVGLI